MSGKNGRNGQDGRAAGDGGRRGGRAMPSDAAARVYGPHGGYRGLVAYSSVPPDREEGR